MEPEVRRRVERATVRLPDRGSQGVLVPGRFVVTAAHCVRWTETGRMGLGEPFLERVETPTGLTFQMEIVAVEAVSDVAVLGPADDQQLPDDADRFVEWAEATEPVTVAAWDPPPRKPVLRADGSLEPDAEPAVAVHVRTCDGRWLTGRAVQHGYFVISPRLGLELESPVPSGTSGGPVVDASGQLLSVVSSNSISYPLTRVLPRWIWSRVHSSGA